jgi:hypothetical protein
MEERMSPELRGMWVADKSLRSKSWIIRSQSEVNGVFRIIRKAARTAKEGRSVKWFKGRVLGHLASDYSQSPFLLRSGCKPLFNFAVVTVCRDGKLMVEQLIVSDKKTIFDRDEASMEDGERIPTETEINAACKIIREGRPISDYAERWVGVEDPGIREIKLQEV